MPDRSGILALRPAANRNSCAALTVHVDPESLIICSGCKDTELIRTALLGRIGWARQSSSSSRSWRNSTTSRAISTDSANRAAHRPPGFDLLSKGAGKWATSGGENSQVSALNHGTRRGQRFAHQFGSGTAAETRPFLSCRFASAGSLGPSSSAHKEAARFWQALQDGP